MTKKLIFSIIASILPLCMIGASYSANEAMQKAAAKVNTAACITADFSATSNDGTQVSGKIKMSQSRFALTGADYGVWYNGTDMWSYSKQTGEASLTTPTIQELQESNPFDIINSYSSFYTAKTVSSNADKCVVRLTAKDKTMSVKTADVTIDTKTWLPTSVKITFSNSTCINVAIKNVKILDQTPKKQEFEFPSTQYPNVDIVDLR